MLVFVSMLAVVVGPALWIYRNDSRKSGNNINYLWLDGLVGVVAVLVLSGLSQAVWADGIIVPQQKLMAKRAAELDVLGSPTFVVDGVVVRGTRPMGSFLMWLGV